LVTSWEIEHLKGQLAEAAEGKRFVLQGGDCAERFDECESASIAARLKILLQMSLVLVHGGRRRVVRIGRFAGQYAKPRSSDTEERDGTTLPAYRGDIVNALPFDEASRTPDPERLLMGHSRSALTLNFIRSLIDGGFADLHHPEYWDLEFMDHSPLAGEYQRMVESIGEGLRFMETLAGRTVGELSRVDFYTCHEGLLLEYEEALTRPVPHREGWWNLSTHMPWIGLRTADPEGGHVEYFRGIRNPIAIKVGPGMDADHLKALIERVDPEDEPGRLTLIHRFGAHEVAAGLPTLLRAVREMGRAPLWICDPMHGNTQAIDLDGRSVKTRKFGHILAELEQSFDMHEQEGTRLGGVHFELTGEDVTECTGGARGLADGDLGRAYRSYVDPRLNYEQALEMAMLIARRMQSIN
jgi:3-deoxy-7-phosphoheptulonate synthase